MKPTEIRFLEPLDVLVLRGNKLFGDPGSYGESAIPPWPSVASGALRSRMLADAGADLADPTTWPQELGTPAQPGPFTLVAFHLGRRTGAQVETLLPLPADLSLSMDAEGNLQLRRAVPTMLAPSLASSTPLPLHPVLAETVRSKPISGYWLTAAGWQRYLHGELPAREELVHTRNLWQMDERVGVGLSAEQRAAEAGKLFTTQAIALQAGVGFVVGVQGATPPASGLLRLGGDGRGAAIMPQGSPLPQVAYEALCDARRCRIILTSPGIFAQGWLPYGFHREGRDLRLDLHGVRGRLRCAATPRHEVVSGFDLARWQPKAAQRAVPVGSVYWLDELEATPAALRKFADEGLWSAACEDSPRRAEGFNRFALGFWEF